jgi:hypothetical protein
VSQRAGERSRRPKVASSGWTGCGGVFSVRHAGRGSNDRADRGGNRHRGRSPALDRLGAGLSRAVGEKKVTYQSAILTKAERAADQGKQEQAVVMLTTCELLIGRMKAELQGTAKHPAKCVPTEHFFQALEWATLQLRRARYVQERSTPRC